MTIELRSLSFAACGRRVVGQQNGIQVEIAWFSFSASTVSAVIVDDGSYALAVGDRAVGRPGEVDEKRLIGLLLLIAADEDGNGLRRLAWRELDLSTGGKVVAV